MLRALHPKPTPLPTRHVAMMQAWRDACKPCKGCERPQLAMLAPRECPLKVARMTFEGPVAIAARVLPIRGCRLLLHPAGRHLTHDGGRPLIVNKAAPLARPSRRRDTPAPHESLTKSEDAATFHTPRSLRSVRITRG